MATAEATRLTEAFRAAEARQAAAVAALAALYYQRRVNADDPESVERWLAALVPVILRENAASAARGVLFGNTLRTLELGLVDDFRFEPVKVEDLEARVRTSLIVTGITGKTGVRRKIEKISGLDVSPAEERALLQVAREEAAAAAGGAAARHVQAGGRESLRDGVQRDLVAVGFVRVTKPKPCYYCAMLAGRGAVYKGDSFDESNALFDGPGRFKVHDSCGCTLMPIYRREDFFTDEARAWSRLWGDSTKGKSGRDAIKAFRQAYEGRA